MARDTPASSFLFRARLSGVHHVVNVYGGAVRGSRPHCGTLRMRDDEWVDLQGVLEVGGAGPVEVTVENESPPGEDALLGRRFRQVDAPAGERSTIEVGGRFSRGGDVLRKVRIVDGPLGDDDEMVEVREGELSNRDRWRPA